MQQTTWEKEDRQPALQRLSPAQDQGEQRLAVNAFLTEHWGSTVMMVRGEQGRLSLHAFRGRACAKICLAPAKRVSTNEHSRRPPDPRPSWCSKSHCTRDEGTLQTSAAEGKRPARER